MADRFTKHHIYFPRRDYKSALQKRFRSLPCNVVWMREHDHQRLHLTFDPPVMPSAEEMREAIAEFNNGQCGCDHHHPKQYGLLPALASMR